MACASHKGHRRYHAPSFATFSLCRPSDSPQKVIASLASQSWQTRFDYVLFHEYSAAHLSRVLHGQGEACSPYPKVQTVDVTGFFQRNNPRERQRGIGCSFHSSNKPGYRTSASSLAGAAREARARPAFLSLTLDPPAPTRSRAVCNFWYAEFLSWAQTYESVLRIDCDCEVLPNQPDPFILPPKTISSVDWQREMDERSVTHGLARLFERLDTPRLANWSNWASP